MAGAFWLPRRSQRPAQNGLASPAKISSDEPKAALGGTHAAAPFSDEAVPIVLGEHVTTEAGTGCVHTAPAHGLEDFEMGRRYDLEVYNPVGGNGVYHPDTPVFAGQHIFKANDDIIAALAERDVLLCQKPFQHSYPHCWRHKTPIIFRATPQWFISMSGNGLLEAAQTAVEGVQWVPDWGRARIDSMLEKRPDWCISRQRRGVPIALFRAQSDRRFASRYPVIDGTGRPSHWKQRALTHGLIWIRLISLGSDATDYEKVTDTLDVWFDSGGPTNAAARARRTQLARGPVP